MKPRRCPRCGSTPLRFWEYWTGFTTVFEADKDGHPEEIGLHKEGDPTHVIADCKCGHSWRLRGVLQITDLARDELRAAPSAGPSTIATKGER